MRALGAIISVLCLIVFVGLVAAVVWWPERVFAQPVNITAQTVVVNTTPMAGISMVTVPVAPVPQVAQPLMPPQIPSSGFSVALLGLAGQLENHASQLKVWERQLQNTLLENFNGPWFYRQLEETRTLLTNLRADGERKIATNTVWTDEERAAVITFRMAANSADTAYGNTRRAYNTLVNLAESMPPPPVTAYALAHPEPPPPQLMCCNWFWGFGWVCE